MKFPGSLLVALACMFLFLFSGGASHRPAESELHILMWSDYIDPDLVKQFEATENTKVIIDVYEETEAMLAKLQAGEGHGHYDLVVASDHSIPVLAKLGLIGKPEMSKVPNAANISPRFVKPPYDPKGEYSLPYQWGTVGVIYNKAKLPDFKPSWSWVLDGSGKHGRLLMLDSPRDTLGAALKATGVSVNSRDPGKIRDAGRLVLAAKNSPTFIGFEGSVAAAKKVIAGNADLALVYNGDALNAIKDANSKDFDYVVPEEGTIIWVDTMVVTAKAANAPAAHAFMNFILDAGNGARLSNFINYASPNEAALPRITPESRADIRIYPSEKQLGKMEYLEDVGDSTRLYDTVWTAIKAR